MEERYLLLLVPQQHEDSVYQLVPFGHPIHKHCVLQNALLRLGGLEEVGVFDEGYSETDCSVCTEESADDVMEHEGSSELKGVETPHDLRGCEAHEEIGTHHWGTRARDERVKYTVVHIPHCRRYCGI